MKIVLAGGSGHVGAVLLRSLGIAGNEITLISRSPSHIPGVRAMTWDGRTLGDWSKTIDGADVVINLAGRTVNCRYTAENLKQMMDSRVDSTRVIGQAIAEANDSPKVWLQASTATLYAHRFDAPNDEATGTIGGDEPGSPYKWKASIEIVKAWEKELDEADTPKTRKVAMRSAITLSADKGSVFDVLCGLVHKGLGGRLGTGGQYMSWIHEIDFARAVDFLIERDDLSGAVNLSSPNPLPQAEFMRLLRDALGVRIGLPAPAWLVEIGTWAMRTESELVLKSRRVVPRRLLEAGFRFQYPEWCHAAKELVSRLDNHVKIR